MGDYSGAEKRKANRARCRFLISYRSLEEEDKADTSQLKDMSAEGILLTTSQPFVKGQRLSLSIRLPFTPEPVVLIGLVVDSQEIIPGLIYDTRLEFLTMDEDKGRIIAEVLKVYLQRKQENN